MRRRLGRSRAARGRASTLAEEYRGPLERRRDEAARLVVAPEAAARIASAPPGYLLAHASCDVARHCELLSPLPAAGEVRVVATPARGAGEWRLDLAGRDRPGMLAAVTGVLAAEGIGVVQAVLATWDDGAALEAFVVHSAQPPDALALQHAFEASLGGSATSPPVPDARLTFTDPPGALYTCCDVEAADRPGLLHAVAVAIATAGADVHAARVATDAGMAHDRFDLSDGDGHPLSAATRDEIRALVHTGAGLLRPRLVR